MKRFGQVLRLRDGAKEDYQRYHDEIWPEVRRSHLESGLQNYSIFSYGNWLFAYFELQDDVTLEEVQKIAAENPFCQKWEEIMQTLQEPLPESDGVDWWVSMQEIWHLE